MTATSVAPAPGRPWLFSARVDVGVFLGSALASLLALAIGARAGLLDQGTPDWAWVPFVLLVDVAHVWATGFRVYLDPVERRRRPLLYLLTPLAGLGVGIALYAAGELWFWRALAYLAVLHFVRQQAGWVALYRARAGERDRLGRWLDAAAIYAATLYPLLYWHTHLPRRFWWFLRGDFAALPAAAARVAAPLYWAALAAYAVRALARWARGRPHPGKDIVVATTAVCWYVGIVACNGDYAFTVTNVLIHGIPYFALVYWYARTRQLPLVARAGPGAFLGVLWALAYVEELLWDRGVWHERAWLFGHGWDVGTLKLVLVPLLAVPQITHYVLDGFVWRRRQNPTFSLIPPSNF
ncbi:MAG TPA: hypothetical protein VKN99_08835 [Polyangia bacterium]|nr:hypothetical protein [Polyangia bacterium]